MKTINKICEKYIFNILIYILLIFVCVCFIQREEVLAEDTHHKIVAGKVQSNIKLMIESRAHGNRKQYDNSIRNIVKIGKDAVPELVNIVKGNDNIQRHAAILILHRIGWRASIAIPNLIEIAQVEDDDFSQITAIRTLGKMSFEDSNQVVPFLIKIIETSSSEIQHEAIISLENYGLNAKKSIPVLVRISQDKMANAKSRLLALDALSIISPNDKNVIESVLGMIKDKDFCIPVLEILGRSGEAASLFIPEIISVLNNEPTINAQIVAAETLGKIGAKAQAAIPHLLKILHNKKLSSQRRMAAAVAIGDIHEHPMLVIPKLIKMLSNDDVSLVKVCATSLGKYGSSATSALPFLINIAKQNDVGIGDPASHRIACVFAIVKIDAKAKSVLNTLFRSIIDSNPGVRIAAAIALGTVSKERRILAASILIKSLNDDEPMVRIHAASSLCSIHCNVNEAIQELSDALHLKPDNSNTNAEAAKILMKYSKNAKPAVPGLIEAINKGDLYLKLYASRALGEIGINTDDIVKVLINGLQGDDETIKIYSAEALVNVGHITPEVMSVLEDHIFDPIYSNVVISALGKSGVRATKMLPKLELYLKNPYPQTRLLALTAIKKIKSK